MSDDGPDFKKGLATFLNETQRIATEVSDAIAEGAVKSKEFVDDKLKERELNRQFQLFGKDVFRLVAAGKVELPPELDEHVQRISQLVAQIAEARNKREAEKQPPPSQGSAPQPPTEPPPVSDDELQ